MIITSGLFDNMVLQRDRHDLCLARFCGECDQKGILLLNVKIRGKLFKHFTGIKAGKAAGGKFKGELKGLPAGGPYDIELVIKDKNHRIAEQLIIRNVLVGDLWILGGQSNMEGIGYLKYALKPNRHVRAFYMEDRWNIAKDPIHNLFKAVDPVHAERGGGTPPKRAVHVGAGPGIGFGQEMLKFTGVPQGLIPCAHGGTSMSEWDPALKSKGGHSLYGAMLRRFRKNGGKVAGLAWYQGCSDTGAEHVRYTRRMVAFTKAVRKDFDDKRLPVAMVQIAGVFGSGHKPEGWNSVQEQQRLLPQKISRLAVVPAIDLSLDDSIHISGYDQNRLGKRLAQAMSVLRGEKNAGLPPIELDSANIRIEKPSGVFMIRIKFRNVMGGLQAAGKPAGFTLFEGSECIQSFFRTDLEKDTVILRGLLAGMPRRLTIYHGYGCAPYCNITDSADRSLPVFGPYHLGSMTALGDFIVTWLLSKAMPSAGKLEKLAYPRNKAALQLKRRAFKTGAFCDLHTDLFDCAPDDRLVYFVNRLNCCEAMKLELCLGYDGPIKVWIDGRQLFHDPKGTNPASPADKAIIPWKATRGKHEIVIALGSNHGRAWGICAHFRRRDVPRRVAMRGPTHYKMPEILD